MAAVSTGVHGEDESASLSMHVMYLPHAAVAARGLGCTHPCEHVSISHLDGHMRDMAPGLEWDALHMHAPRMHVNSKLHGCLQVWLTRRCMPGQLRVDRTYMWKATRMSSLLMDVPALTITARTKYNDVGDDYLFDLACAHAIGMCKAPCRCVSSLRTAQFMFEFAY